MNLLPRASSDGNPHRRLRCLRKNCEQFMKFPVLLKITLLTRRVKGIFKSFPAKQKSLYKMPNIKCLSTAECYAILYQFMNGRIFKKNNYSINVIEKQGFKNKLRIFWAGDSGRLKMDCRRRL